MYTIRWSRLKDTYDMRFRPVFSTCFASGPGLGPLVCELKLRTIHPRVLVRGVSFKCCSLGFVHKLTEYSHVFPNEKGLAERGNKYL